MIGLLLTAALATLSHLDAVAFVEIEHNRAAGTFEIAIRGFPEQFERALTLAEGRPVPLTTTPAIEEIVTRYVADRFQVRAVESDKSPKPAALRWVGMETSPKETWIYLELPAPESLAGMVVACSLLMELHPEQVNTVNWRDGDLIATSTLRRGREEAPVLWQRRPAKAEPRKRSGLEF